MISGSYPYMMAEHKSWRKQVLKILLINDFRSSEKNSSFYVKASKNLLFVSNQMTQYFFGWVFLLLKVFFFSLLLGKYCLIHLKILKRLKNEIITLKSYIKQDNVQLPHTIILFKLDFDVNFLCYVIYNF